jgi:hypothetical protein
VSSSVISLSLFTFFSFMQLFLHTIGYVGNSWVVGFCFCSLFVMFDEIVDTIFFFGMFV